MPSSQAAPTCTVEVTRPPRLPVGRPGGELVVEPPPEPERAVPVGLLARLLPAVMLLGSIGFVAVLGPRNPTSWLFGGMFAISTLGMVLTGAGGRGGGNRVAGIDEDRRDYLRYLASLRRRVRRIAAEQRAALEHQHPDPAAWPAVLAAGRLWERAPGDSDFGELRVGLGDQWLATRLIAPQTGPVEGLEPITAVALRRFLRGHAVVPALPMALSLRASGTVWLEPDGAGRPAARALARALVVQYVLLHSPADARLAIVAPPGLAADWDWVGWLPHSGHPTLRDGSGGPARMVAGSAAEVRRWWAAELAGRTPGPGAAEPHLLIVVDGRVDGPGPWAGVCGVTVLRVGAPPGRRPGSTVLRLGIGSGRLIWRDGDKAAVAVGRPDGLERAEAAACARRLARFRPAGSAAGGVDGRTGPAPGLPELLDLPPGPGGIVELRTRWSESDADRLRVPIGVDDEDRPVTLDLKESAQGGSGPHGLCVGATGSGKSELLRSMVLGLAATHSSLELNLVLVDFKGGATFLDFAALPHVSAVITNLADELALVDRMAAALTGEIRRRQELLRAAGNLAGILDYADARRAGAELPPLPALLVVVDEFSELLAQRPELIDLLVTIGRVGRSLGLHLLLASQRLDEGRMRGLESHLSYRIALRTFSAAESRAVLGVPDAHRLTAPGQAYLAAGSDELVRFRAMFVSGPGAAPAAPAPAPAPPRAFRLLPPTWSGAEDGGSEAGSGPPVDTDPPTEPIAVRELGETPTVLATMIAAMSELGPPAHRVWLPPLDLAPALDELLGAMEPDPQRGLTVPGSAPLRTPYALLDRPVDQRRDLMVYDLTGASGHLAVIGGPRAGKSTGLCAVVLGLALTSTPAELGVHVIDFGGGALAALTGLPHVGTVADGQQGELVRRLLGEFDAALARRERLFREAAITSIVEFRARRATGDFADEPATDLLLVVDGYLTLRGEFDDLEARLLPIAAKGLSYGLHLAVTANRWSELRPALKDLIGERIELRLGDVLESEVDRRLAAGVPARPGHGLAPDGSPALLAAPCTSTPGSTTSSLVAALAAAWPGPAFAPVRLLPERIELPGLPEATPGRAGLPLGVDERFAGVRHDFAAEPHLICLGDAECGKTALLRLLAHGVGADGPPDRARIVVVDPRRTLLDAIPATHLLAHASSATAIADTVREIAESLRRRLPGPTVSARELRDRSWWTGPELYLLVDDYDLVVPSGGAAHPLAPLVELLPQAKDVGLHLVVARRSGGAARALFDPLLGRLRELGAPALVMNGSPDEGPLIEAVKPTPQPPGRGILVDRRHGARLVQLAWLPPDPGAEP